MKKRVQILLMPLMLLALSTAFSLRAATLTVTSLADSGPGSLRDLVTGSLPGDTIQFAVNGTILLNSAIPINHTLQVFGPGAALLTVSGNFVDRVFITSGNPVFIAGMKLTDGVVVGTNGADGPLFNDGQPGGDAYGGAILDTNSLTDNLILSNCWVDRNTIQGGQGGHGGADGPSATFAPPGKGGTGGYAHGGAIYTLGDLSIINCTFSHNRALGGQGGIGGTDISGIPTSVTGGTGGDGGWGQAGAVDTYEKATAYYINSTFSLNDTHGGRGGMGGNATADAGGQGGGGGNGLCGAFKCGFPLTTATTFWSCTIVSNSAFAGPGGLAGPGTPPGAAGNVGIGDVGGVCGGYTPACLSCLMADTVLADNFADTSRSNFSIGIDDLGYNYFGTDDSTICEPNNIITSRAGTIAVPLHAQLGPLAQNGGGMPTHATTLTCPLTDAGNSFGLTTDERGAPRPYDFSSIPNLFGGDGSDIGAFELGNPDLGLGMNSGTNAVVSWPAFYGDFTLQTSTNLPGTNSWSDVPDMPVVLGNQFVVTNQITDQLRFFRLISH